MWDQKDCSELFWESVVCQYVLLVEASILLQPHHIAISVFCLHTYLGIFSRNCLPYYLKES